MLLKKLFVEMGAPGDRLVAASGVFNKSIIYNYRLANRRLGTWGYSCIFGPLSA